MGPTFILGQIEIEWLVFGLVIAFALLLWLAGLVWAEFFAPTEYGPASVRKKWTEKHRRPLVARYSLNPGDFQVVGETEEVLYLVTLGPLLSEDRTIKVIPQTFSQLELEKEYEIGFAVRGLSGRVDIREIKAP